jgi:hypothetical protein
MALKKNRKQAQETMLEEPNEDQVVPLESIKEEEPKTRKDQDEPESEEEHEARSYSPRNNWKSSSK